MEMARSNEGTTNFLKQFKPLIHKCLQQMNITPQNMDYEDYYQELQIKLIEIVQQFKAETSDVDEKNCKFIAYAGRGLYWHGIDLLRQKQNHSLETIETEKMEWLAESESFDGESFTTNLYADDFLRLAKKRLSSEDFILLLELAEGKYTMDELAEKHGVVRATIYQRKERIQTRLQDIKGCLTD